MAESKLGKTPHCAVVFIKAETMQRLPDGKVSNQPLTTITELFADYYDDEASCDRFIEEFIKGIKDYGKNIKQRLAERDRQAVGQ